MAEHKLLSKIAKAKELGIDVRAIDRLVKDGKLTPFMYTPKKHPRFLPKEDTEIDLKNINQGLESLVQKLEKNIALSEAIIKHFNVPIAE